MNKGFVTSALLYGILSLFLILVMNTVAIIGNRKLAIDKLKQSALDDVQKIYNPSECFETTINYETRTCVINKYIYDVSKKCASDVYIPGRIGRGSKRCTITEIASEAFKDQTNIKTVTIDYNFEISDHAFDGCRNITFIVDKHSIPTDGNGNFIEGGQQQMLLWGAQNAYVIIK